MIRDMVANAKTKEAKAELQTLFAMATLAVCQEYESGIQEAKDKLNRQLDRVPNRVAELIRLRDLDLEGIKDYEYRLATNQALIQSAVSSWGNVDILATVEDLRKLRQEFGPFELNNDDKEVHDKEANTVAIAVKFKQPVSTFRVRVVQTLPEDAKCKIVEVENVSREVTIVCDR